MHHHSYLPPEPLEDRIAPAGLVTVAYSDASGILTLDGDDLGNSVDVLRTGADTYQIQGLGGTMLTGSSGPVSLLNIGKLSSLTINGNGGADDFGLTDLTALKVLKFNGGAGDDFVISTNLAVKGDVTFDLGADGGLIAFTGASTVIGGDFKAIYGDGGSVDFFSDSTTIKGAVKLTGGGGDDAFSFGNDVNVGKGLDITDSAGGMSVAFQNANIVIGKGKGGDSIEFDGGTGADSLMFVGGSVTLKGDLEFAGGAGSDSVDLNAASLRVDGKVTIDGGADADQIKIAGSQVTLERGVSLFGGGGGDEITLSADQLKVDGPARLEGGDGDDTLNVLADALSLSGSLTILGGGGANVSSVFADGQIRGDVNLDLGGADGGGDQTFLLGGISGAVGALKIGGSLNVASHATDPLNQGFSDFFWATDVTVGRSVEIGMGAVDSFVFLDNIFVRGGLAIDTGDGNDTVDFERNGLTGPSMIGRLASIQLGAGDDVIRIGKSSAAGSNDYVIFKGGLRVDGGPGTDASNDFLNDAVNVFGNSSHDDERNCDDDEEGDDDDDDERHGFDGHSRFVKERLNFEGPFIV